MLMGISVLFIKPPNNNKLPTTFRLHIRGSFSSTISQFINFTKHHQSVHPEYWTITLYSAASTSVWGTHPPHPPSLVPCSLGSGVWSHPRTKTRSAPYTSVSGSRHRSDILKNRFGIRAKFELQKCVFSPRPAADLWLRIYGDTDSYGSGASQHRWFDILSEVRTVTASRTIC